MSDVDAKILVGKIIKAITTGDGEVVFETEDNEKYRIFTNYSTRMIIEEYLDDLIGTKISSVFVDWNVFDGGTETIFTIYGKRGFDTEEVEIRWFGEYSEEYGSASEVIDFEKIEMG